MKKELKIAGLCLWEVEIRYQTGPGKGRVNLWITTSRPSMLLALEKAKKFLSRSEYLQAEIRSITDRGTLDA